MAIILIACISKAAVARWMQFELGSGSGPFSGEEIAVTVNDSVRL